MLERSVAAAVGLVALAWPGPVGAEEPAAPPVVVPTDRLPVLGTVGDYPPEAERLVVEVFAGEPPRFVVEGKEFDRHAFHQLLLARANGSREWEVPNTSTLHLVLRVDRSVPWWYAQWILGVGAEPDYGIYRVFFAALPEDGTDEGAMALYLPRDRSRGTVDDSPTSVPHGIPVQLVSTEAGPSDPGPSIASRARRLLASLEGRPVVASIDADPGVATGAVLRSVDALLRSGVRAVTLRARAQSGPDASRPTAPMTAAPHAANPRILVLGEAIEEVLPEATRPAARERGGFAGQTSANLEAPDGIISGPGSGPGVVVDRAFGGRRGGHRNLKGGPTQETEDAVFRGLEWLKNHQSPDGRWNSDGFEAACGDAKCGGSGGPLYDVGVTGLATLAFLGYGETHKTPRYGHVVRNALKFLKLAQDAEGCFSPRQSTNFTYNHAIATLAMVEAYGLTQSPLFKSSAQNGVNFILQCRNPGLAWRYGVRPQDNDTSITGWMVMALKSAKSAGLDVPDEAFQGAVAWLDKVTDPETGRTGYTAIANGPCRPRELMEQFPPAKSESLTAIAVLSRILSGAKQDDPMVRKGTALCLAVLPKHDDAGTVDFTYWMFGTMAMFQVGDSAWTTWHHSMKAALVLSQRKDEGHARGSWDPKDPWAGEGGRIYSTALGVLSLETYYRYARVFGVRDK